MYEENHAIQETCTIVKNVKNDIMISYFQVFNSKGNLIAVDVDEYKRIKEQDDLNSKHHYDQREEMEKKFDQERQEFNRVRQKWNTDFDKLKDAKLKQRNLGAELIDKTLKHLQTLKRLVRKRDKTVKDWKAIQEAEKFFDEVNSIDGKYAQAFTNNDLVDKYVDVPDYVKKRF